VFADDSVRIYDKLEQLSHHFQCLQSSPSAQFREKNGNLNGLGAKALKCNCQITLKRELKNALKIRRYTSKSKAFNLYYFQALVMSLKINEATKNLKSVLPSKTVPN
jgi:hypothetical protein